MKQKRGRNQSGSAQRFFHAPDNPVKTHKKVETDDQTPKNEELLLPDLISDHGKVGGKPVAVCRKQNGIKRENQIGDQFREHK